jgi:ribosomal protein S18 acetylase RimI-like enzyme
MIEVHFEILDVGTAWGVLNPETGQAEIKSLFVTFDRRGQGFGCKLLDALEARMVHHGARELNAVADAIDTSVASATYVAELIEWYKRRGYIHHGGQLLVKKHAAHPPA